MRSKAARRSISQMLLVAAGLLAASCGGRQSAMNAAGIQAERLEGLWWLFFYVTGSVYVIVMVVIVIAFLRRRRSDAATPPDIDPDPARERRMSTTIVAAIAVTAVILFTFMVISFRTGREINTLSQAASPVSIKVTGHQWWWDVQYQDIIPSNNIHTANEIHLPAGRPIKIELESNDVIHSFWLPNMHGKKDLIPNYPTTFFFQADKPGIYWGQCAEFCGYEHAKMRFLVVVHTPEEFDAWVAAQRQVPPPPTDPVAIRGQQIFLTTVCAQCHTVQGTAAGATVGPNLTHIASRQYIAAGSLPNTREHLASWVTDPQKIKPGIRMPMNMYSDEDLNALVTYLETLK